MCLNFSSCYNATKARPSVHRIEAKAGEGMELENVHVRWDVGRRWGCCGGWFAGVRKRERGDAKTCFSAVRAVYVYYLKDIHHSDCVMLWRLGTTRIDVIVGFVEGVRENWERFGGVHVPRSTPVNQLKLLVIVYVAMFC